MKKNAAKVYGDNFATWEAEWFSPAQEILSQYPFLFMRGNHENCDRAHKGWFRYLDAYPFESGACKEFTKSWTFDASIMQFYVFDSAYSTDLNYYTNTELIKKQLTPIKQQNKPTWFLTHKPLWNLTKELIFQYEGNVANTKVFIDYFNKYKIPVVISGHAHIAQILFMANNLPTQIIVGNGGSSLHSQDQKAVQYDVGFDYVENIPSFTAEKVNNFFGFGFAVLDLPTRKFSFYSKDNKELYSVVLTKDFQWKKEKTVCSVFEVLSKEWLK